MSLKEQLEAHSQRSSQRLPPGLGVANDILIAHLRTSGMLRSILAAGDRMPAFELADADGRFLSSRELSERGRIVVSFFRGDWCPYCRLELHALQEALLDIEREGANLVAITPDTGAALGRTKRGNNLSFAVLSDPDHGVALRFGVAYNVPNALREQYLLQGLDLAARHGNSAWFLPVPATFVVDCDGIIQHVEFDADHRRRMEPADIIDILRKSAGDVHRRGAEIPRTD
jgi:peroxiredoxin